MARRPIKKPRPARAAALVPSAVDVGRAAPFPVVGVGASAGGLEAFTQLLQELPADSGMAFVLIQHLDPNHASYLTEALERATAMPVREATDGVVVEPDHVYVMPPNTMIEIEGGRLKLAPRDDDGRRPNLPIDLFLRSLATERGSQSIGIVLSGTASDGTDGLLAIKAENGFTFVQEPSTAKFDGMPRSAIDAGAVDYSMPIAELAKELVRLSHHPYVAAGRSALDEDDDGVAAIIALVRRTTGIDFGEWKAPTFGRRLARRMALKRIDTHAAYLAFLERNPDETRALGADALIHVTSFFRDPEVFEALKRTVFPAILANKPAGAPIRMWVAGCSTGEEVYSLTIALLEHLGDRLEHPVQVFGSDVSEAVIAKARTGVYSETAIRDVTDDQRRRFFTKIEGGSYRINKAVRDLCVFNRHDLSQDPPFSKLDLASCRNVFIYFGPALQKRLVPMFHYCLNDPGFLLLGRTESVTGFGALFSAADKQNRIFARMPGPSGLRFPRRAGGDGHAPAKRSTPSAPTAADPGKQLDRFLLARYAPPGVLVNESLEVLQFRGQTGAFLQHAPGAPQTNLAKMVRPGIIPTLRAALAEAKKTSAPVCRAAVEVIDGDSGTTCDLVVIPFSGSTPRQQLFAVLFEPPASRPAARARRPSAPKDALRFARLEQELATARDALEVLQQEQSFTNDDLGSTNEELVSGNEELQSMNEELETAKEELQSTNEELTTVNDELQSRNLETNQINSDLVNLLTTVDVPILFLDRERKIRRFTPRARTILNVLPTDVGRALDDIKLNIQVPDLDAQVKEVIDTVVVRESEVTDHDGRWYRLQIRPYKTIEHVIDGAIVSLVDIDALKALVKDAEQARADGERANVAKDQFLATLSHELRTPLASMLMQAQLLARKDLDVARVKRIGEAIERSTLMQVQLIEDLLDVSRIVTGNLIMERERVDFAGALRGALETLAPVAARKPVTLAVDVGAVAGVVIGDAARLAQVVVNLVGNAIKFTPAQGTVTVRLSARADRVRLQVTDTGIGIDPQFLPSIFQRFSQEDMTNTRRTAGLGIGLSIVHHLVVAHGGTITAESDGPGRGSVFTVELPLVEALAADGADGPRAAAPIERRLEGLRILLVEDDGSAREALGEMLRHESAVVCETATAADGMAALGAFRPDVLVCDLAMPDEDGLTFIKRVRALRAGRGGDIPALALTALAGEGDVRRAIAAGFQMHVPKPVGIDKLTASVLELIALAKAPPAPRPS